MKALFKIQRAGKTALPILRYILTLKGKQLETLDLDARVGAVITSPDLQHLQANLQASESKAIAAAAKEIEKHTRLFTQKNSGRHRDHFTISAPSGMSHKLFKKLAIKAVPELAVLLKLKSYVAVIHKDCKHPHLHIVSDAYAPSLGRGVRRHIDKSKLKQLDSMQWTKHFDAPTPTLGAKRSKRGKEILKHSFASTSIAKVDFAAQAYKALGGKLGDVEAMTQRLQKAKFNQKGECDFYDKKGKVKASASLTSPNGIKLRLSHIVKYSENYRATEQFKTVDASLTKKAVKKTYSLAAPPAVKAAAKGAKEVLKVFKLAGGAVIDALTVDEIGDAIEAPQVTTKTTTSDASSEDAKKRKKAALDRYYEQNAIDNARNQQIRDEASDKAASKFIERQKQSKLRPDTEKTIEDT